jgi:hypothetical protein
MPVSLLRVARANLRIWTWRVEGQEEELRNRGLWTERVSQDVQRLVNGMRVTTVERRNGWLRGKGFEDRNPMGGCGVKQSHEAQVGRSR